MDKLTTKFSKKPEAPNVREIHKDYVFIMQHIAHNKLTFHTEVT